jgi:hypothetical protein
VVVPSEENQGNQKNPRSLRNPRSQESPRDAEHTEENKSETLYNYTIVFIKFLTIN